jgi:WD40 repeat protein
VTDFGLAKKSDAVGVTVSGMVVGTPSYMAPEQARGDRRVGPAADVWALGVILYQLLTGKLPFDAPSPLGVLHQVTKVDPVRPGQINRRVPRDLEVICLKCLAKEPGQRYISADALADDLRRWLEGHPIEARPVSSIERAAKYVLRHPTVSALIMAVVLAIVSGASVAGWFAVQATASAEEAYHNALKADRKAEEVRQQLRYNQELLFSAQVARARQLAALDPSGAFSMLHDYQACPIELRNVAWNMVARQTQQEPVTLHGHLGAVLAVASSSKGQFASGGEDGTLRLWDGRSGATERVLTTRPNPIRALVFSPDGSTLIAASARMNGGLGELSWWNVKTGGLIEARKLGGPVLALAYNRKDHTLASLGSRLDPSGEWVSDVTLWDGEKAKMKPLPKGGFGSGRSVLSNNNRVGFGQRAIAFDYKGELLATIQDFRTEVWDATTGKRRWGPFKPLSQIRTLCFSPTQDLIVLGDGVRTLRVRDAHTGKQWVKFQVSRRGAGIAVIGISPDGQKLAVGNGRGGIEVWDLFSRQLQQVLVGHQQQVSSLCFSHDGKTLISSCGQPGSGAKPREIRLWDVSGEDGARTEETGITQLTAVALTRTGSLVALVGRYRRARPQPDLYPLRLWDPITEQIRGDMDGACRDVRALAFSPQGDRLAVGHLKRIEVWDVNARKVISSWKAQIPDLISGQVNDGVTMQFSPDGASIAAIDGNQVRIWESESGKTLATLDPGKSVPQLLTFDPSGSLLAVGGNGFNPQLWDIRSGKRISTFQGSSPSLYSLAFSPDSSRLVASGSEILICWDVQQRKTIFRRTLSIRRVSFSPDGRNLVGYEEEDKVDLLAPQTGLVDLRIPVPNSEGCRLLQFREDGSRLYAISPKGTITLWNTSSPRTYAIFQHLGKLKSLAFSTDGQILRIREENDTLTHWNLKTGLQLSAVTDVEFKPESQTGSTDKLKAVMDRLKVQVFLRSVQE